MLLFKTRVLNYITQESPQQLAFPLLKLLGEMAHNSKKATI